MAYTWEGNYTLPSGKEVCLELKILPPKYDVGIMDQQIDSIRAWDSEGVDVDLTDEECELICVDEKLWQRIEDAQAAAAGAWYVRILF